MGFACDRKYLDISKETFGQGLESGLLYVSLTKAGEKLARLSANAPALDGPPDNETLKDKAVCELLLDGIDDALYTKLRANAATIQDICFTFVVSEHQPAGLETLVGPLLKGYIAFYLPYPSDEKTFKRFLDSNGINPRNYSDTELASIPYYRGYEKSPTSNAATANEKKRRHRWRFW
jgi:hypothetical protein